MTIFVFSRWTTFLDCAPLGEDLQRAPPYTKMGEALFDISSLGLYLDDDHHMTPSSMGIPWDHTIPHGFLALSVDHLVLSRCLAHNPLELDDDDLDLIKLDHLS